MRYRSAGAVIGPLAAGVLALCAAAGAARAADGEGPTRAAASEFQSVYAPPESLAEDAGFNSGGVAVDLAVSYLTDYVWRGIDRSESAGSEDSSNLQVDGTLNFDLGRYPHPYVGVFVNVYDSDPVSRFQEVRPYLGFKYNLRPVLLDVGHANYIFPERDEFNTAEVYGRVTLDDGYFFRAERPILAPYVFGAFDYDRFHGVYLEAGVSHDFAIEDTGVTLTPNAHASYVVSQRAFRLPPPGSPDPAFDIAEGPDVGDTGFQHFQVGVTGTYVLNPLLNIPRRYGELSLKGYLNYTDGIDDDLRADTQLWGGVGIGFKY